MDAPTLGLIAAGIAAAGTSFGAWLSRRTRSTTSSDSHSQSQTVAVDVDRLVELAISGYREEVDRLKTRVLSLETQVASNRNREMEDKAAIRRLQSRVDHLTRELELIRTWVRAQGVDPDVVVLEVADAHVEPDDDT